MRRSESGLALAIAARWGLASVLLVLLSALSCNNDYVLFVNVDGWPADVAGLTVHTALDGVAGDDIAVDAASGRFAVRLAFGQSGVVNLSAVALDSKQCKVATGSLSVPLGSGLKRGTDATLILTPLPQRMCPLRVDILAGQGTVSSMPAGLTCASPATSCQADFPAGRVQLAASFDGVTTTGYGWSGDCSGSETCAPSVDRAKRVGITFVPRHCGKDKFCFYGPTPQGRDLLSVTTAPSGDVVAVGAAGVMVKCVGTVCRVIDSGVTQTLLAVASNSQGVSVAVGVSGAITRCSGDVCTPFASPTTVNLSDVVMDDAGQAWAVGGGGTVVRCSSTDCVQVPSGSTNQLNRVHITKTGEVYAVGIGGVVLRCSAGSCGSLSSTTVSALTAITSTGAGELWLGGVGSIVIKCVGTVCSTVPVSPATPGLSLRGAVATPSGEVYFVGTGGLLIQCVGATCKSSLPVMPNALSAIVADGNNIVVGGDGGTLASCIGLGCALLTPGVPNRFTSGSALPGGGSVFVGQAGIVSRCSAGLCTTVAGGSAPALSSLAPGLSGEVMAAGASGSLLRCSTKGCLGLSSGAPSSTLFGIWNDRRGNTWAVGSQGTVVFCNGSNVCTPFASKTSNNLTAISGSSQFNQTPWIVGANSTVLRCDTATCTVQTNGLTSQLGAVWVDGNANAWVTGTGAVVAICDGTKCTPGSGIAAGTTFNTISGDPTYTYAAGNSGALYRCAGNSSSLSCSPLSSGTTNSLMASAATGNGGLWLVGANATVVYCQGTTCSSRTTPLPITHTLTSVWSASQTEAWVGSNLGAILRCDAQQCTQMSGEYSVFGPAGSTVSLTSVWGSGLGDVWAIGAFGTVVRYSP
ncbi:MAG: hypothetical protein U0787_14420 [Polyangia bacterium]